MPKEAPRHPQVTEDQVELWLANPVTRAFLECAEWRRLDSVEAGGSGRLVDTSSADITHGLLHRELGKQDAYHDVQHAEQLLDFYQMIFRPPPEDNDGDE